MMMSNMKRTHLKIGILAVAISAIGYWGCQKDSSTLNTNTVTTEQLREGISEDSEAISAKIADFQKTLTALQNGENTDLKMTTDDAVWNIEALLNMRYGRGDFKYYASSTETLKVPIDVDTETFSAKELTKLYDEALAQVNNHYNSLEKEPVRQLILVDIDIVKEEKGRFFTATSVYGIADKEAAESRGSADYNAAPKHHASPFCGTINGALQLTNEINSTYPRPAYMHYYVDIVSIIAFDFGFTNEGNGGSNPNSGISGLQRREAFLYYSTTKKAGYFNCYPYEDHQWYLGNWFQKITDATPVTTNVKQDKKVFASINIMGMTGPAGPTGGYNSWHRGYIQYGKPVNNWSY